MVEITHLPRQYLPVLNYPYCSQGFPVLTQHFPWCNLSLFCLFSYTQRITPCLLCYIVVAPLGLPSQLFSWTPFLNFPSLLSWCSTSFLQQNAPNSTWDCSKDIPIWAQCTPWFFRGEFELFPLFSRLGKQHSCWSRRAGMPRLGITAPAVTQCRHHTEPLVGVSGVCNNCLL